MVLTLEKRWKEVAKISLSPSERRWLRSLSLPVEEGLDLSLIAEGGGYGLSLIAEGGGLDHSLIAEGGG